MVNFEKIAGDDPSGKALTPAKYAGANRAVITVETAPIRFTYDGKTAPTATVGHVAASGDSINLATFEQIKNFKFVSDLTASPVVNANLQVSYENNDYGFSTLS